MKLYFVNRFNAEGNSIGYSTHQKNIEKAMSKYVELVEDPKDADVALHITPVGHYRQIPGVKNILYTMYEYEDIPLTWEVNLKDIDLIVVPCKHNKELFGRYTDIPIKVCWEGVDAKYFKYIERPVKQEYPFTFLWLGANNMRKGYLQVLRAWDKFWPKHQETQLIIKTLKNINKYETSVIKHGQNIIIDNRLLPYYGEEPTILSVYRYANCFIMPSMGEGFCLPMVEAISTGLPAIYTNHSGMADYMNKNIGYPVGYQLVEIGTEEDYKRQTVSLLTKAAWANTDEIVENMEIIYNNYKLALGKGINASDFVRKYLTWDISAKKLISIIKQEV